MHTVLDLNRSQFGVTLVELMVTLAVFAILVTIGIPSFTNLIANNRATAAANELLSTLQFARSEAVKRNQAIVAQSVDGANWADGWSVFRGADELRSRHAQHASVGIAGPATSLTFRPAGNVDNVGGVVSFNFTITVAGNASATRCLELDLSGRSSVSRDGC